ncbi:MAG: hypothetical protein LBV68_05775 [Spirochaetaceae bacterium]|jgi:hypothetical protein|nr:hypothetical protein [Spirochaetaceae bacterium]
MNNFLSQIDTSALLPMIIGLYGITMLSTVYKNVFISLYKWIYKQCTTTKAVFIRFIECFYETILRNTNFDFTGANVTVASLQNDFLVNKLTLEEMMGKYTDGWQKIRSIA